MTESPLSSKVSLDVSDFKTGISELNRNIRVAESEFRASSAGLEDWGKSATGLESRIHTLNSQMEAQRQKVRLLQAELVTMATDTRTSETALDGQRIKINNATAALGKMELESKNSRIALTNLTSAENTSATAATTLAKSGTVAGQSMGSMSGGLDKVVQGLTGFSLANLTGVGSVVALGKAVESAVNKFSEGATVVEKFSRATGVSAEEASRLIQTADDMQVETGTLEQAMKLALKNGFNPTIENMAKLADRYVAIQDPVQRDIEMSKIFGKSWEDIIPMLENGGQAIRDNSAAIEDNMIITQQMVEANKRYKKSIDDWDDAITGAENQVGEVVIPTITELLQTTVRADKAMQAEHDTWVRSIPVAGALYQAYMLLNAGNEGIAESGAKALYQELQQEAAIEQNTVTTQAFREAEDSASRAMADQRQKAYDLTMQIHNASQESGALAGAQAAIKEKMDLLTASMSALTAETLYHQAAQGLDANSAFILAQNMGLIDESSKAAYLALQSLQQQQADGAITMDEYIKKVADLQALLLGMPKDVYSTVHVRTSNEVIVTDPTTGKPKVVVKQQEREAGGPAGGRTLVGEAGPEVVDLPQGSYVHNNNETRQMLSQPVTITIQQTFQGKADAAQVQNASKAGVLEALRAGGKL